MQGRDRARGREEGAGVCQLRSRKAWWARSPGATDALPSTKRPFKAEHQAAIAAFYDEVLTTSPNTKDVCRRRIARWLYEQRPMAIMHDSYKGLYSKFLVKHTELQAFVSETTF